jgi:hypothetical protein
LLLGSCLEQADPVIGGRARAVARSARRTRWPAALTARSPPKPVEQRIDGAIAGQQAVGGGEVTDEFQPEAGPELKQRQDARPVKAARPATCAGRDIRWCDRIADSVSGASEASAATLAVLIIWFRAVPSSPLI